MPPAASRCGADQCQRNSGPHSTGCGTSSNRAAAPTRRSSCTRRGLFARGRTKIAQKLGEEAVEAVIEGIRGDKAKLVGESADLLYHLFVLWADTGVSPSDVAAELTRREGTSGLVEKRGRANL